MNNKYLLPDDIRLELLRDFIDHFEKEIKCDPLIHQYVCIEFGYKFYNPDAFGYEAFKKVFPEYFIITKDSNFFPDSSVYWLTDHQVSVKEANKIKLFALELLYNYIKTNKK